MKKFAALLCSTAVFMPAAAFAQSTGTVETEIVITGTRTRQVGGIEVPDTTKAKAVVGKELINRQQSGQTILNVINLVPSVNFTNSDPYGSSGGSIRIRGFDGNRISLTFDGVPLNDTGNYAIFSNQQLDPELVEQINVGLGVTDVDSPTASAAGGTVNYRTIIPTNDLGARLSGSLGDWNHYRMFGLFQTGALTSMGTKAWIAGSRAHNDKFKGPGEISKYQFNGRVYQPVGSNGDFVSVSGHFNRNRNNFYRNPSVGDLRSFLPDGAIEIIPNALATADNPIRIGYFDSDQQAALFEDFRFENFDVCTRPTPGPGAQNEGSGSSSNPLTPAGCTNYYNLRVNPSNTGNIRGQSRFTLRDGLLLTVDPSYQYVLANGGGTSLLAENSRRAKGANQSGPGIDFNGDGDFLDTVRFFTPNNTNTNRLGLTSSLIWDVHPAHTVRVAYTFDRGRHRQTGEWGFMERGGDPESVFGGREGHAPPVLDASGFQLQQRDRKSIALLNQVAGQYIGRFFDEKLRLEVGVRRPFFKRDLETFCPIEAVSGFAYCTSEPILPVGSTFVPPPGTPSGTIPIFVEQGATLPTNAAFRPLYAPFAAKYKYGKILPNIGFTYEVTDPIRVFGSFAKGFSAPRTDNLYRAPRVDVRPEETNAFDLGVRYTTGRVQAQLAGWKIDYRNRIVTSFNPDLGISIDRNVGKVDSWGFDANVGFRPVRSVTLLALASYIKAELQENVEIGTTTSATPPAGLIFCAGAPTPTTPRVATCAPTAGRMVTETPKWQFGGRAQYDVGPFSVGIQGKRVGARFATDVNDVKVKGYNIVDVDARFALDDIVKLRNTYLQVNLQNVFDEFYFGNISTQIRAADNPSFAVGSPRTLSATLNLGF